VRVAVLAGGTGAARLACGLARALAPGELSVISNTADDEEMWGLLVCPDTDAVLYRLAGLFNAEAGFSRCSAGSVSRSGLGLAIATLASTSCGPPCGGGA
jgi:2-phospho-L-lactate transferase/gluconeogenesis factor (CofD/UPF0052 family)